MSGFLDNAGGGHSVAAPTAGPPVFGWIVAGFIVGGGVLSGFGAWAALAPLASAAMAPGVVKVDSHRKTVQHRDGGIIQEILVRDGDTVRQGQVLMRLDPLEAAADLGELEGQIEALQAREARLIAQRDGTGIAFPDILAARRGVPAIATILDGQEKIFRDQAAALESGVQIWRKRIEQYKAQIAASDEQSTHLIEQQKIIEGDLNGARTLLAQGFGTKIRVSDLEMRMRSVAGDLAGIAGRSAMLIEQVGEVEAQIEGLRSEAARKVFEELREVQTSLSQAEKRTRKAKVRVERLDVVAPQDGVVMGQRFFTSGAVVAPGGALLDIVPNEDKLIIEARVQPLDIDIVRPELPATVRLVAFKQRTTPVLEGSVTSVSADALTDERTGQVYFAASVEVGPDQLEKVPDVKLYPGMPADVAIATGERTLFEYLLQPLTDSFAHAFREQ